MLVLLSRKSVALGQAFCSNGAGLGPGSGSEDTI